MIQQRLEQDQLLRIELLRRATEQPAEQLLQLVLQAVDLAALLLKLFEELLTLSAKDFDFLSKPGELGGISTFRGHIIVDA